MAASTAYMCFRSASDGVYSCMRANASSRVKKAPSEGCRERQGAAGGFVALCRPLPPSAASPSRPFFHPPLKDHQCPDTAPETKIPGAMFPQKLADGIGIE